MNNDPMYYEQKKRIYAKFQTYRRLKEILSKLEEHQYPDQEPFLTLFEQLTKYLKEENILETRRIAQRIFDEWLKWRYVGV